MLIRIMTMMQTSMRRKGQKMDKKRVLKMELRRVQASAETLHFHRALPTVNRNEMRYVATCSMYFRTDRVKAGEAHN